VAPKAKRVVQLFMGGAASHIDLFDFKPALIKHHGEDADFGEAVEAFQNGLGPWKKPVWDFKPYGQSGKRLSDVVAPLGLCADDMAFVHNMVGKTGVHSQGTLLQATGFNLPGFPGMGCWVSYGLGSLSDNLPTFVVLPDHRGFASNGPKNWDSAFLPSQHAGTIIYPGAETPINDLFPHKSGRYIKATSDRSSFALLKQLNHIHQQQREEDSRLDSRIKSYELAAKMQLAAPEALDISKESKPCMASRNIAKNGPPKSMLPKKPTTWAENASPPADSWSVACALCKSGAAMTMAFPAAIGIAMRTSNVIMARSPGAWPKPSARSSWTSSSVASSTIRSSYGPPSLVECPAPKAAKAATTIPTFSPIGSVAAASKAA
jgi:hypothetical protein